MRNRNAVFVSLVKLMPEKAVHKSNLNPDSANIKQRQAGGICHVPLRRPCSESVVPRVTHPGIRALFRAAEDPETSCFQKWGELRRSRSVPEVQSGPHSPPLPQQCGEREYPPSARSPEGCRRHMVSHLELADGRAGKGIAPEYRINSGTGARQGDSRQRYSREKRIRTRDPVLR